MYSNRASVLRWQERNAGLSNSSSGLSIALEPMQLKPEFHETYAPVRTGTKNALMSSQTIHCLAAIILELLIILLVVVFNLVEVTLIMPGIFPNDSRAIYIAGTTVGITAVTAFVSKQIRLQWISYVEMRRIRKADTSQSSRRIENLLGIGPYSDYFYYWGTTFSFLLASLSTAAIVTALAPSIGFKSFSTTSQLTPGALNCTSVSEAPANNSLSWQLEDGKFINFRARGNTCLAQPAFALANAISNSGPDKDGYVYTVAGVGITRSSIGIPHDAHNGPAGFDKIFWDTGKIHQDRGDLQESTQCLPVFIKNPARCRRAGRVIAGSNMLTVELNSKCRASTPIFGADLANEGASASGFCFDGKDLGTITYLIGSINSHAGQLAAAVSDLPAINAKSYSVACEIDVASAIAFRPTTLTRNYKPAHETTIENVGNINTIAEFTISSSKEEATCNNAAYVPLWNPDHSFASILTPGALSVAAGSVCPLFTQNRYNNGWWDSLSRAVQGRSSASYGFEDSKNAMEDVLGLITAMSFGQYVGSAQQPESTREAPVTVNRSGVARVLGYRIGSGSRWGLAFIIPEVWIVLLLSFLLIRRVRLS